jgi:acetyl esterase
LVAAALALMANERGDVRFVQQSLYYPVTDAGAVRRGYGGADRGAANWAGS